MKLTKLLETLDSGGIIRFHACPKMRKQRLSDHMWKVALITQYLLPNISKDALLYALTHDSIEIVTGDIPATLKWKFPEIKDVLKGIESKYSSDTNTASELEKLVIKLADFIDGMLFCYDSYNDGCKEAKVIFDRWVYHLALFLDKEDNRRILESVNKDSAMSLLERLQALTDHLINTIREDE